METTGTEDWPSNWSRAFLELCTLAIIERNPHSHGYAIMAAIKQSLGTRVTGGVIYPLLRSMEEDALLSSSWEPGEGGPGRKEYALTAEGSTRVAELHGQWRAFQHHISSIVEHQGSGGEQR